MQLKLENNAEFILVTILLLATTAISMQLINLVPLASSIRFFVAVFVFVFAPGYSILKLLKYNDNAISYTVLSLLTGMAITPFLYSMSRTVDQTWIFIILCLACVVFFIASNKNSFKPLIEGIQNIQAKNILWLGFFTLCLILFLLNYSHFGDLLIMPDDGYLLRTHPTTESIFHLGIINAVKTNIHPPYLYLSGYTLSYHLDMHLFSEFLGRYSNISSLLITYYFIPLFYTVLIISVAAVFFYKHKKNIAYSILFGFTIYAADISFLANLISSGPHSPYTEAGVALKAPMWSLFTLNGIMPAVPLLFGVLIMLDHFFKDGKLKYILLACLYIIASFRVKSSMGPHILGALIATIVILHYVRQDIDYKKLWPAVIVTSSILILEHFTRTTPTEAMRVIEFSPLNGLYLAFTRFNIEIPEYEQLGQQILLASLILFAFMVYVVSCFGVKIYFIKNIIDSIKEKRYDPTTVFLFIFIISGFTLSELIYIGSKESNINNGQWFSTQSLYASGFFVIYSLTSISATPKRILLTALTIILLFSGTAYFLNLRNTNQFVLITHAELALSDYMDYNIDKDSVVLEALDYRPSTASHLTGISNLIAVYMSFLGNNASGSIIDERGKATRTFYFENNYNARIDTIKKYGIDYIIFNKASEKSIYDGNIGDTVYENEEYLLIKTKSTYSDKNRSAS